MCRTGTVRFVLLVEFLRGSELWCRPGPLGGRQGPGTEGEWRLPPLCRRDSSPLTGRWEDGAVPLPAPRGGSRGPVLPPASRWPGRAVPSPCAEKPAPSALTLQRGPLVTPACARAPAARGASAGRPLLTRRPSAEVADGSCGRASRDLQGAGGAGRPCSQPGHSLGQQAGAVQARSWRGQGDGPSPESLASPVPSGGAVLWATQ